MSQIVARVREIESVDNLNIVKFDFYKEQLTMMSLELNDNIKIGTKVKLGIKSTHIVIAKSFSGIISYSNQIKAKIVSCENGKLLSSIKLLVEGVILESIITRESSKTMDLKVGDDVTLMIKASELSIVEILDD
ncbi:MAG: TOBE domain-containing protein [Campylobacterota bacterium]|nr:TOBE domain-containing protein [Campylobacterota bacterium]